MAHYHIAANLGQGGMGEVHHAIDTKLRREVVIKILPPPSRRTLGALTKAIHVVV